MLKLFLKIQEQLRAGQQSILVLIPSPPSLVNKYLSHNYSLSPNNRNGKQRNVCTVRHLHSYFGSHAYFLPVLAMRGLWWTEKKTLQI